MILPRLTITAALATACIASAHADSVFGRYDVQTGVGTTGLELSIARAVKDTPWVARASLGRLSGEDQTREGSVLYNAKLRLNSSLLNADYHIWNGRFKASLGLALFSGDISLNSVAQAGDVITIGNRSVVLGPNDYVRAQFKLPSAAPYIGLGWTNLNQDDPGFTYSVDLGVTFVNVKSSLDVSPTIQAAAGSAQVEAERQKLQNSANDVKFYPILRAAMGYRF